MNRQELTDTISTAALAALAACAVVITATVARREFFSPSATAKALPVYQKDWRKFLEPGTILESTSAADIIVLEFGDYQCQYCKAFEDMYTAFRAGGATDIARVYRHLPLEQIHGKALDAAIAQECASRSGHSREYHAALYAMQETLSVVDFTRVAQDIGIKDTAAFVRCLAGPDARRRVEADVSAASRLSIRSTPTLFVNGHRIDGAPTRAQFDSVISLARSGIATR